MITSIPVETILNTHHFITCCVHLHIDTNSISIYTSTIANYQWPSTRHVAPRGVAGVHNVDALITVSAQVISLTNMVKVMTTTSATVNQVAEVFCVYCGEGHLYDNCPGNPVLVNYVGNFNRQNHNNPYSNTYNPKWRQMKQWSKAKLCF